ncbi:MAG TPA: YcaO-like family protein [Longimicrobium sp.]
MAVAVAVAAPAAAAAVAAAAAASLTEPGKVAVPDAALPPEIRVRKLPAYNDEPRLVQFHAVLTAEGRDFDGYGCDRDPESAEARAVFEAVERSCLAFAPPPERLHARTSAISPGVFQSFSDAQLSQDAFRAMRISDDDSFGWAPATDCLTGSAVWIPAQLVFCPYDLAGEPLLRFPSSNGTACARSPGEARCKAALEVIERDAFMCGYLSDSLPSRIDLDSGTDEAFIWLLEAFDRYRLELDVLLLPSDWGYPVVLAILRDASGIGPALTVGAKCHPRLRTAILGAVHEAHQIRPWLRDEITLRGLPALDAGQVRDFWTRALYWAHPDRARKLEPLWRDAAETPSPAPPRDLPSEPDWAAVWEHLLDRARLLGTSIYAAELSTPLCRAMQVSVAKVVIPDAHPLYLDERYPYTRSPALARALDRNGARQAPLPPHPFA